MAQVFVGEVADHVLVARGERGGRRDQVISNVRLNGGHQLKLSWERREEGGEMKFQ